MRSLPWSIIIAGLAVLGSTLTALFGAPLFRGERHRGVPPTAAPLPVKRATCSLLAGAERLADAQPGNRILRFSRLTATQIALTRERGKIGGSTLGESILTLSGPNRGTETDTKPIADGAPVIHWRPRKGEIFAYVCPLRLPDTRRILCSGFPETPDSDGKTTTRASAALYDRHGRKLLRAWRLEECPWGERYHVPRLIAATGASALVVADGFNPHWDWYSATAREGKLDVWAWRLYPEGNGSHADVPTVVYPARYTIRLPQGAEIDGLAYSPDGKRVAFLLRFRLPGGDPRNYDWAANR